MKLLLKGSKTAENLAAAFAGESMARTRYLFYAEVAEKEGFPVISDVFLETADNERGHAEVFYEYLSGEEEFSGTVLHPGTMVPVSFGTTPENLFASAKSEFEEWSDLYREFARVARDENYEMIARSFSAIASIEKRHDYRFRDLLNRFAEGKLFRSDELVLWECTNCGLFIRGEEAPETCPACLHKRKYFKLR